MTQVVNGTEFATGTLDAWRDGKGARHSFSGTGNLTGDG